MPLRFGNWHTQSQMFPRLIRAVSFLFLSRSLYLSFSLCMFIPSIKLRNVSLPAKSLESIQQTKITMNVD